MKRLNTVSQIIKTVFSKQLVNVLRKPECKIILNENPLRHRHKIFDYKRNTSKRYPTFFTDEDIEGKIELKFKKPNFEHYGIRAELHGIIEKYNPINSTITEFTNLGIEILRPGIIENLSTIVPFSFKNTKLIHESYKGLYAQVKYYIKIIINSNIINYTYEEEFAAVNPNDEGILIENDDSIKMSVGIQNLLSIDFELEHINYNCRGTIKGLISFNYIHLPIKFVEIQLLKNESVFTEKKEPFIIESFELIDGSPIKNDVVPFRFFLKSYNLTPTYKNINNIFCVKYYINLIIGDFENNTFFKQTEIKLFRTFKKLKNPELNYGPWEEFISEPMYNEEYYNENNNIKENENKDINLNNIFNKEKDDEMEEEEEYEEEDDEENEEKEDNEENDNINDEFTISTSTVEKKKTEEIKNNKKKKKAKKYGIVNILRSNSLYKSDKNNISNNENNINNINNNNIENNNNINIPFNDDDEDDNNKYINNLISTNFPYNSDNNLFNNENNNINNNSKSNNSNEKIIKFDD